MATRERGVKYFSGRMYQRRFEVVTKTANYTVLKGDSGKVFTTKGAVGAVIFTLPSLADAGEGWNARFIVGADQNVTITAPAAKLVAFNNAAATSIAFSTLSEKIGAVVDIVCDGNFFYACVMLGAETQTPTIS